MRPVHRRGTRLARWPLALAVSTGLVLGTDRWTSVVVADWLLVLVRMVFAVSLAAVVIAGFMAFVLWWFWSRDPH